MARGPVLHRQLIIIIIIIKVIIIIIILRQIFCPR